MTTNCICQGIREQVMDTTQWWATLFSTILLVLIFQCGQAVVPDDLNPKNVGHNDYHTQTSEGAVTEEPLERLCPALCSCERQGSRAIVHCDNRGLRQIPLVLPLSATNFVLDGNQLVSLGVINHNNLQVLTVSRNRLSFLQQHLFDGVRNLEILDLSSNDIRGSLPSNLFANLTNLVYLNVSRNSLRTIGDFAFFGLNSLKILDLSHNRITNIGAYTFSYIPRLEYVDLSNNLIVSLKHEWFQHVYDVITINLHNNRLQSISNVLFYTLRNLRELDLSQNEIASVGLLSFKGLGQLEKLNLSRNHISYLHDGTLKPVSKLQEVDFSHNPIRSLDRIFTFAKNLHTLYLEGMKNLTRLTSLSFVGLKSVTHLSLCNSTGLQRIDKDSFATTSQLEYLDLSGSGLTTLKTGTFDALVSLRILRLERNPWHCSCYLYWLLLWLGNNHHTNILGSSNTLCHTPQALHGHTLLDALDHKLTCVNASIKHFSKEANFQVGASALLQCHVEGSPMPSITWITPQRFMFHWTQNAANSSDVLEHNSSLPFFNHPVAHGEDGQNIPESDSLRFNMLKNGNLFIKELKRGDSGFYRCVAANPLNNQTAVVHLMLDYRSLMQTKIVSILVGIASSCGFLLLTLLGLLIEAILNRFGIECPCGVISSSRKAQQIRRMLDNVEQYKRLQLDRLRENYTSQVQRIKENCVQQIEKLRESYSAQMERFRDIRDYGNQQIDRMRDNYYSQVHRVRDYSASQIDRLRENYLMQRNRIRKFSAHQLYKLRENYKLQQQHLNKILENLNIESCRNACGRTDSVMFEPEIVVDPVFMPAIAGLDTMVPHFMVEDITDSASQVSAYFTPEDARSVVSAPDESPSSETYREERTSEQSDEGTLNIPDIEAVMNSDDNTTNTDLAADTNVVNVQEVQYVPEEDDKAIETQEEHSSLQNAKEHNLPENIHLTHSTSKTSDVSNETSV